MRHQLISRDSRLENIHILRAQLGRLRQDQLNLRITVMMIIFGAPMTALLVIGCRFYPSLPWTVLQRYHEEIEKRLMSSDFTTLRKQADEWVHTFENELLRLAQLFLDKKPQFSQFTGIRQLDNSMPWKLNQLPATGKKHLMFFMADWFEHLNQQPFIGQDRVYIDQYIKLFPSTAYQIVLSVQPIKAVDEVFDASSLKKLQGFLDWKEGDIIFNPGMPCPVAAQVISQYLPHLINYDALLVERVEQLTLEAKSRDIRQSQLMTMLVFLLLLKPMLSRLVYYWSSPKENKDYARLSSTELEAEEKKLSTTVHDIKPQAQRRHHYNNIINIALLLVIVNYLLSMTRDPLTILMFSPLWIALLGGQGIDWIGKRCRQGQVSQHLNRLEQQIITIVGDVHSCLEITPIRHHDLACSYLTIVATKSYKSHRQEIPKKCIIDLLKMTLHRFQIKMIIEDFSQKIWLSADTTCKKLMAATDFFSRCVERCLNTYELGSQIQKLQNYLINLDIVKQITLDEKGLPRVSFMAHLPSEEKTTDLLKQYGFTWQEEVSCFVVRDKPINNFATLLQLITINSLSKQSDTEEKKYSVKTGSVKRKQAAVSAAIDQNPAPPLAPIQPISWSCGAIYPSPNVSIVHGIANLFIRWTLEVKDFNNDQTIFDLFNSKKNQLAKSKNNSQGVKLRDGIFGNTEYMGTIDLVGKHGNWHILLRKKTNQGNQTLLTTDRVICV